MMGFKIIWHMLKGDLHDGPQIIYNMLTGDPHGGLQNSLACVKRRCP